MNRKLCIKKKIENKGNSVNIMNKKEIYKDIKNYEGLYKISLQGNVFSLISNKKLKPNLNKNGYYQINLYKNTNIKCFYIHRLVALHFIPNLLNKSQVNHIDGNKLNNHIDNLEQCTVSENNQHACDNGLKFNTLKQRIAASKVGKMNSKNVYCKELNRIFKSTHDVERLLKIPNANISNCCRGKKGTIDASVLCL